MAVYFILAPTGHVKIGTAGDPRKRLKQLQTAWPGRLELLGVLDDVAEDVLHRKFADNRVHGEWFDVKEDLREFLEQKGIPLDEPAARPALFEPQPPLKNQRGRRTKRRRLQPFVEPSLKPAKFGGCLICNAGLEGKRGNLCHSCANDMNVMLGEVDPRYPENDPHGLWQPGHLTRDNFEQELGPKEWPFDPKLVAWIEHIYLYLMRDKPQRGALFSLTTPAAIRLAGPFALRQLADKGEVSVFDGGDGFYYARKK